MVDSPGRWSIVPAFEDVEAMFYSDRNVYNYLEEGTYLRLKEQGIPIAYFKNVKDQPVLPWVEGDTTIIWIEDNLK